MQPVLLDSDTVSEILKGRNAVVEAHKNAYVAVFQKFTFTSATLLEVLYGYERVQAHAQIKRAETLFAASAFTQAGARTQNSFPYVEPSSARVGADTTPRERHHQTHMTANMHPLHK